MRMFVCKRVRGVTWGCLLACSRANAYNRCILFTYKFIALQGQGYSSPRVQLAQAARSADDDALLSSQNQHNTSTLTPRRAQSFAGIPSPSVSVIKPTAQLITTPDGEKSADSRDDRSPLTRPLVDSSEENPNSL